MLNLLGEEITKQSTTINATTSRHTHTQQRARTTHNGKQLREKPHASNPNNSTAFCWHAQEAGYTVHSTNQNVLARNHSNNSQSITVHEAAHLCCWKHLQKLIAMTPTNSREEGEEDGFTTAGCSRRGSDCAIERSRAKREISEVTLRPTIQRFYRTTQRKIKEITNLGLPLHISCKSRKIDRVVLSKELQPVANQITRKKKNEI